jgi:preprotein translocase subunit YajC
MNSEILEVIRLLSGYFIPILMFVGWIVFFHFSNYKNKKKVNKEKK